MKRLRRTPIPTATVFPDVPLEEFQFCIFQRWRTGEVVVTSLTLLYGALPPTTQYPHHTANLVLAQDTSAFIIIVYSARNRRNMNFHGVPNLLDNIVQGASMYFFVIFTGHLLLVLFEIFAPVSDRLTDSCSFAHYESHTASDPTPSCQVSRRLGCCYKD